MKVLTNVSGSPCVVQLRSDWEAYIEDRGHAPGHSPTHTNLEFVRQGHVRLRKHVSVERAPHTILQWVRRWKAGVMP